MRRHTLSVTLGAQLAILIPITTWVSFANAQVGDGQRAAARDLFRQGDELQRAGRFSEALDKFKRAEQLFAAPTNELRIAECEAALGQIVESGEEYRLISRAQLSPGSPAAFQAAVDQAKAEFAALEPRIPHLVVEMKPALPNVRLIIDGQNVSPALIGQAMPLDPGIHKVAAVAGGYGSVEQSVLLKEHETHSVELVLTPVAAVPPSGPSPVGPPPTAQPTEPPMAAPERVVPDRNSGVPVVEPRRESRMGFIVGGHLGANFVGGALPAGESEPDTSSIDLGSVAGAGAAIGLDAGFRFARRWYVGATLEHALFAPVTNSGATSTADSTLVEIVLGLIVNPDRVSFYGEVAIGERWFHYAITDQPVGVLRESGEFSLGGGVWIPIGPSVRLLPKATLGLGGFHTDDGSTTYYHAFFMLGTAGFYNADF